MYSKDQQALEDNQVMFEKDGGPMQACVFKLVRRNQYIQSLVEAILTGNEELYCKLADSPPPLISFGERPVNGMKPLTTITPKKLSEIFPLFLQAQYGIDPEKWVNDLSYRKGSNKNRPKQMQEAVDEVTFYIGDLPVHEYKHRDFKRMLLQMTSMPAFRGRRYNDLSIEELEATDWGDRRLSVEMVKKYRQKIQQIFNFIVRELNDQPETRGLLQQNPVPTLKELPSLKGSKNNHGVLSDSDLTKIASSEALRKHKNNWRFWLYVLLRATGARSNEIAQLKICDVKWIPAEKNNKNEKIYFLNISCKDASQSTKTENSNRKVPIHPLIIKLGFLQYLEKIKKNSTVDAQLWQGLRKNDGYYTSGYSRWFTDNILKNRNIVASRFDECDMKKVAYSTRATFATQFSAQQLDFNYLQQIIGHCSYPFAKDAAAIQNSTTKHYIRDFPLINLYDEIAKYEMPDLENLLDIEKNN